MSEIVKDKFKVTKFEKGQFDYDTVFINCNDEVIQIPINKGIIKDNSIVGKSILIPCIIINDNEYLFSTSISQLELM